MRRISSLKAIIQDRFFLIVIVIAALILRVDLLIALKWTVDSDEAIVGLMANHILEGKGIPVFYYGQHYMGSLEPILASCAFAIFGSSPTVLKCVPLFISLLIIPIIYLIGFRLEGKFTARIATLFYALPSAALVEWSSKARGGFIEVVFIGVLALYISIIWIQSTKPRLLQTILIGLLLGLGWWTNNQIIYFMGPIGLFMLLKLIKDKQFFDVLIHSVVGVVSFLVGGAPFWIYNLKNNWASFGMFGFTSDLGENISGFFTTAFPIVLGAKRFWHEESLFPGAEIFAYMLLAVILGSYLLRRGKELLSIFVGEIDDESPVEILFIFCITTIVIFVLSSFGYLYTAPRYLLPIYPALYILFALGIKYLSRKRALLSLTIICIVLMLNFSSSYLGGRNIPGEPLVFEGERVQRDHLELINWLQKNNYSTVKTNYWIGYKLAFETGEKVKFFMVGKPYQIRMPEYETSRKSFDRRSVPIVMTNKQSERLKRSFTLQGEKYREINLSGYTVLYDIGMGGNINKLDESLIIPSKQLTATSNLHNEQAKFALDGDLNTRWGSGVHQSPGMEFIIKLETPTKIRAIDLNTGKFVTDVGRRISIECNVPNKGTVVIADPAHTQAVRDLIEFEGIEQPILVESQVCDEIILRQLGKDDVFDWSIAEVSIYRDSN